MNATIIFAMLAVLIAGVVAQILTSELVAIGNMFPS